MNKNEFQASLEKIFSLNKDIALPMSRQMDMIYDLWLMLDETNKKMNLTAITEPKAAILRHFLDSLTLSAHIPSGAKLIDIGCGAGFPALPLAICRADIEITAIDSTAKKITFVNMVVDKLKLKNLKTAVLRAEEGAFLPEYRERFDVVTARAVASLPVLCELCLPYCKENGNFIAMKSKNAAAELLMSLRAAELCGGEISSREIIRITENGNDYEERSLIIIKKVKKTPKIYPRIFSQISKKPL